MSAPGDPSTKQAPYPMPQPGSYSKSPYPVPQGGYGDPSHGPPPAGVKMGYPPQPQPGQPIMHQPGPAGHGPMPHYGGPKVDAPGGISPAPALAPAPASVPVDVPPGLEYLTQIDQILIHQADLLDAILGFETNNEYDIKNILGQQIYKAEETNDCCTRNCIGSIRSFDMLIKDNTGRAVIRLIRPLRCDSCLCPCCLQELEVQAPPGITVGYVSQVWHPWTPKFTIQGANQETVMTLEGPCFAFNCCGEVNFEVRIQGPVLPSITKLQCFPYHYIRGAPRPPPNGPLAPPFLYSAR